MSSGRRATVLVVDDNLALADNLREILDEAGYEVRIAGSCEEARRTAALGFHLALIDVRLPDGDGTALATELRRLRPDAEVILLTGFATVESAISAVRAGAWAYLVKPCSPPDLLLAVSQAVQQAKHVEEKRELQQRAIMAEKLAAIGTLTAGLSHEIRNPLNAAALQLSVLEMRMRRLPAETREEFRGPLVLVQSEIRRLNNILEDFLQFARPRAFLPMPVELSPIIERVLDLLDPQAHKAEVDLVRKMEPIPPVLGEPGQLQQVVMNLVLNAIQATPRGGSVQAGAGSNGESVELVVEDTGPGIDEEMHQRIFEPFFTTKEAGSGLGLPMVHAIVQQHRGAITVERGAAGGARFVVTLPAMTSGQGPTDPGGAC